jgi:hypothetical protein
MAALQGVHQRPRRAWLINVAKGTIYDATGLARSRLDSSIPIWPADHVRPGAYRKR